MSKWKNPLLWLLLAAAVCVMAVSIHQLWDVYQMYEQGDRTYEEIAGRVHPTDEAILHPEVPKLQPSVDIPPLAIDFVELKAVNADAIAWLYCPDTVIDYSVMRADDYDYYLHHLPDGTYNANGSLFLDYNCQSDFSGRLNIIYGHHMNSGKMFASLAGYKEQAYFEEHPYLYLYTEQGNYRVDFLYGCVVGTDEWRDRAFMFESNLDSLQSYAAYPPRLKVRQGTQQMTDSLYSLPAPMSLTTPGTLFSAC